ncbi:MAG: chorismate mutase [Clostridiaceae bacterium]|nr:chorismate mutase [Clostridiaceae bacterium]
MEINQLRDEIDRIDSKLISLFEERMQISKEVAAYKKANKLPLLDEKREKALFKSRLALLKAKHLSPYLEPFLETIVHLSKSYQFKCTTQKNVVLIGMMGSGKTTKGKLIAKRLGMTFIDIDEQIEKKQGKTISQLFQTFGSAEFRQIEHQIIQQLSTQKDCVISTGGGVVLDEKNMHVLKENGIIIFLNRDIEEIVLTIDTKDRPLLNDGAQILYSIYNERLPLYKKWCDIEITSNSDSIDEEVDIITKELFILNTN